MPAAKKDKKEENEEETTPSTEKSTKGVKKQKKTKKPTDPNKRIAKEYCDIDEKNVLSGPRRRTNVNYKETIQKGAKGEKESKPVQRESANTYESRQKNVANITKKKKGSKKKQEENK
ncbi:hypothetical protein FDP41_004574 [Naegleria fowleri]|uniref:Uncharacterized protein n=1 Tax=Naegleria fowleri TaxID=5763 RepID=A0A6A5BTF0_NAEFO|nr:uncharacterized protein FDP41_004574 [Naegleria fowleri]KAF0976675.1 hypothetical protein FDP41_004574 [Naegleria fowleri]CAG4708135.1 unnamed protein product [Naegleria fowleri]